MIVYNNFAFNVVDFFMSLKKTIALCLCFYSLSLSAKTLDTWDYGRLSAQLWQQDLQEPWSLSFADDQLALFTEKGGKLWQVVGDKKLSQAVQGTPAVNSGGQGGLLAVAFDPSYQLNRWVYLAYSHPLSSGVFGKSMTRIERGKIIDNRWVQNTVIFEARPEHYRSAGQHFGSRIVFDQQGYLYFSVGDRGKRKQAQSLNTPNGKIHRIYTDGKIPADNPYKDSVYQSIFSYGHRNPQGLAVHPVSGQIWSSEHGPKGGDELNLIESGVNYGWPAITYGINYIGTEITPFVRKEGMQQPAYYWRPSIAVSNIVFYQGELFSKWKNKLLVSSLKYQQLSLLDIEQNRVMHEEVIFKDSGRIRDVAIGPDGAIYIVLNAPGQIIRLSP